MAQPTVDVAIPVPEVARPRTIVGLGEVLFDVFEDGTETLGGAPLNVAVHAHQLLQPIGAGEGIVASRIGRDGHGEYVRELLKARGMPAKYIQTDDSHETGRVSVFMHEGEPGYQIEAGAAWDFMEENEALDELAARCDAVCFGSLAQRTECSRATIRRFLQKSRHAVRLYDVNFRRNKVSGEAAYSIDVIEESCALATVLKINDAELVEISRLFDLGPCLDQSSDGIRRAVERVLSRLAVESVILTRGGEGTMMFTRQGEFTGRDPMIALSDVHPVGAGDACSAAILCGLVLGWKPDDSVDLANRMGAWVASHVSATPPLPDSILAFVRDRIKSESI